MQQIGESPQTGPWNLAYIFYHHSWLWLDWLFKKIWSYFIKIWLEFTQGRNRGQQHQSHHKFQHSSMITRAYRNPHGKTHEVSRGEAERFSPWVQWQRTERRVDLQLEISEAASYFRVKIEHFIFVSNLYIPASITIIRKITLYKTRDLIWCWKMHFQHDVAALKHHKCLALPVHKHVLYAESFNMHPIE